MKRIACSLIILTGLLSACAPSKADTQATIAAAEAQAVATFAAELTQTAQAAPSATATLEPSATPEPTSETAVVTATFTAASPTLDTCNVMTFREDITIPDGEVIAANATFTKIWNVENNGTCNWSPAYQILFSHGDRMDGARSSLLNTTILAGDAGNISLSLRAPATPGEYTGWWTLANALGEGFGYLSVVIIVP